MSRLARRARSSWGLARLAVTVGALASLSLVAGCGDSAVGPSAGSHPPGSEPVTQPASVPAGGTSAAGTPAASSPQTRSAASGAATNAASGSSTSAAPTPTGATRQIVLRPVTPTGSPAAGWGSRSQGLSIDCSAAVASPVAESGDVLYCSPSAASAIACWRAADPGFAYCLADPRARTLNRFALQGKAFSAAHPAEFPPAPVALDLADGTRCSIRIGGAAARLAANPSWVPYYFCGAGDSIAVWAAPDAADGGVLRGDGRWTVQVGRTDGSTALRTLDVATAYFVAAG